MGEIVNFKSNHGYGEVKSRVVGKAPASRKDALNTFLTLNEFLESKFDGTKRKTNSVDAVAIGTRHGIDPDLLISVKKSADQSIIALTGQIIYGESEGDLFGWSTDMSEDGLHLAVGSILNDGIDNTNAGSVRVYSRQDEDGAWVQKGVDIDGEAAQDYSGWSISLSSDGNRLVIGAVFNDNGSTINSGHVRIYDWNSGTNQWGQMGSDLMGGSAGDFFGYSVSLSKNKNYLAVGAPYGLDTRGYVRVYYYNGTSWDQVGDPLEGAQPFPNGEYFGKKVTISEDGSRLAASAPHYYLKTGKVNLYRVDQGSNSIHFLKSKIGSRFFCSSGNSLDLKSNTLALSETGFSEPKIIVYDISSDSFVERVNNKIPLINSFDVQVKLSYDGTTLIYGMSGFNSDSGVINSRSMFGMRGHVKVFKRKKNSWILNGWKMKQIGGRQTDEHGKSVSISGDGGIICISAPRKDVPSSDTGCVATYTVKPISHYVTPTITLNSLNPFPLQAKTTYVEPGAVTDTGAAVTIVGTVEDSTIEGAQYDIEYTSQNGLGNTVTKTRQVIIIKDPAIPTMVLNGAQVILAKVDGVFNDPGVSTSILSTITIDSSKLDMSKLGSYELSYSAISAYGIRSTQVITRTVVVVNDIHFAGSELLGDTTCMSIDGYMVAISKFADDSVVFNEWDPVVNEWKSIGQKIQGPTDSNFGAGLELSNDGLTAVIGAPGFNTTGLVRVYEYDFIVNRWVQKGGDIIDGVDGDTFGEFVTISGDGSVVTCGASQPTGVKNPYLFTYKYTSSSVTWVKIHEYTEPLTLPNSIEKKRFSCSLNNDGSLILVGSPMNNYATGAVFVYDTSDASLKFTALGTAVGNYLGESVNFSGDARRIVIGDVGSECVKIYNQDQVTNVWNQLGTKIYKAGSSVNLSKNGDIATFSIPSTVGYGKVYQYKWDGSFWLPIINEFSDNGVGTSFGRRVFVTDDGSSIFVESAITNQLFRWNVTRSYFTLNSSSRVVRGRVDQVFNYDYVATSSNVAISGVVDTSITSEYIVKYTVTENDVSDIVYQVVSISGELLQLGLTIQSFIASATPIKLGWSTSMSGDGNYLVIGMPGFDNNRGMTKIYKLNIVDITWDEMISLTGPNPGGSYGYDVSISTDGSRVAIGAPDFEKGLVEVYEYTTVWNLIGSQINGAEIGNKFGWSVSLNGLGEYLTVGEPRKSFEVNTGVGAVKTYRYITSWDNEASLSFENNQIEHQIGYDAVISSANNVVLFGAPTAGPGYVKISSYINGLVPIFAQPITFGERFGWCVSISDDGSLFAVGAPFFNAKRGRVLIYDANTTPPSLRGSYIEGKDENDELGSSIHLSGDGHKLVIYTKTGRVSAYKYVGSEWVVIDDEIITSRETDSNFGYSLSSSTTGKRLVISSPLFSNSSGMVQVFSTETSKISNADFIAPVIALNGESVITHKKDTTFNEPGVTRDDGEVSFVVSGDINSNVVGSYTLVYSATDVSGNVSNSLNRTVDVKDPTILNHLNNFPAPVSRGNLKNSRNSNTALAGKRVAICDTIVKVYDVSDDVIPSVHDQVGQTLPEGNQVGLSQDGTKLYMTKIVDVNQSRVSVFSLESGVSLNTLTNISDFPSLFNLDKKNNYKTTRDSSNHQINLFGTGVIPYGERYRQSFKFKTLAISNNGKYIAIGKPNVSNPSISVYEYDDVVVTQGTFTQIGYNTVRGNISESLAVSEAGDRLITQDGEQVLIYNRNDSSLGGWDEEFTHTGTIPGKVALSRDGNVAAFVLQGGVTVPPITLTRGSLIIHVKGETFTDPGFSYSGGGSVTVTETVDVNIIGEHIITYESSDNKQVRIVRVVESLPTTMSGSHSATNIPYGPNFAGWTGTWRNHTFDAPLFTVPSGFVHVPGSNFELSITLNGVIPVAGNWQYMSIHIFTDNGFAASISFTSNGSGQGEFYNGNGSTYTNKVRSTTSITSGSLSAGDQVKGRLDLYNTFFSTFAVDVAITIGTASNDPIPTVTLVGFSQNEIDVGDNFVDPGVTSNNSTGVITPIDEPTFPQQTSCTKAIIYRAVNTSGIYGYAVRYVNVVETEKVVLYGRSGVTWSLLGDPILTPASLGQYSFKHLTLSNDGNRVVFSKHDKNIIYDFKKNVYPHVWTQIGEITSSGTCITMSGDGETIAIGDSTGRVHVYNFTNWALQTLIPRDPSLPGANIYTPSIDISKDGGYIAVGYISSSQDGAVTVYTINGTKRGQTIKPIAGAGSYLRGVGGRVSISSDGTKILTTKLESGLGTFAYYEYNSASWIEHGPVLNSETSDLLELSLSGNGNSLLLLYTDRFKVKTPTTEELPSGWTKIGADINFASITGLPAADPQHTPGNRTSPGVIQDETMAPFLGKIGHVVDISNDGTRVAIGLPFLPMGYVEIFANGFLTKKVTSVRGAAVVFTWDQTQSEWNQLGGLIVPKYLSRSSLTNPQNEVAECTMYSGASISLSGDGQYLCVGSPGYLHDQADKQISNFEHVCPGPRPYRYMNSLPDQFGYTSWTLYKRNASYAPSNNHYSVGWEPIHTKYSEMSQSLGTISTLVPKRELIGHNVKVSSDGSFVVYDTRTDGIKIEAFDSSTNSWSTSQHITHDVTSYLNTVEYTVGATNHTYPIHYLGKNMTGDPYTEDWDDPRTIQVYNGSTYSYPGIGKGGYVARLWPHSYISLSSDDQFLTISEPEVPLPTIITHSGGQITDPQFTKANRQPRVNVYKSNSGLWIAHGATIFGGSTIPSVELNPFASSYSSISDDGTKLIVPSKDDHSNFYTCNYNGGNDSWTIGNPNNIEDTNYSTLSTLDKQNHTAAAQSITLMTGDGIHVTSLYLGSGLDPNPAVFRMYRISVISPTPLWDQRGNDILVNSTNQNDLITPSVSLSNDATKLAIGLSNANSVKILNYSNDIWSEVANLTDTGQFGDQVVLTRDGNSLAVSAPGGGSYGKVFLYDTSTSSVTLKANTLQNTSVHSNGTFGYSLALNDNCTRLFVGDPDYSNDISDINLDTGRVVIKEYDATIDSGTGLPAGFGSGTPGVETLWANSIRGVGYYKAFDVAVDSSGNVYVTGYHTSTTAIDLGNSVSLQSTSGSDAFIVKYNKFGTAQWAKQIDGTASDFGLGVAVDSSGNVYMTGQCNPTTDIDLGNSVSLDPTGSDAFIAKYNTNGIAQWAKTIKGTGPTIGNDVAVDSSGSVYMAGSYTSTTAVILGTGVSLGPSSFSDAFIAKYNTDGIAQWAKTIGVTTVGRDIAVDSSGSVYMTGYFNSTPDRAFIVKYNTSGIAQWTKFIIGTTTDGPRGHGVAVDSSGGVYICGRYNSTTAIILGTGVSLDPSSGSDAFIAKYNTNGDAQWAKTIEGTGWDEGEDIAVDSSGSVYICGRYNSTTAIILGTGVSLDPSSGDDAFIAKYNTNGIAQWAKTIDGTGFVRGNGVAVDSNGNVYMTGQMKSPGASVDMGSGISLLSTVEVDAFIVKYRSYPLVETILTRGGTLLPDLKKYTRFGESLDVSGDGTRLIASRLGAWSNGSVDQIQIQSEPLEIAELWDQDQNGNWSKISLQPILPIVQSGSLTSFAEKQSPIAKISDSGEYFLHGVSELSSASYGSNVTMTATQQYFSPKLTLIGASKVDLILGSTYTDLGCTSDDSTDTIVITNDIGNSVLGIYTVRYTVTRFGLSNFIERKVEVKRATLPPTITLIGDSDITITQPVVYTEPDPPVISVGGVLETYGSPPDGSTTGTFTMRYVVRNTLGTATTTRTITVDPDITPPEITLWGGDITHKFNTTYRDPSYFGSNGNESIIVSAPSYALALSKIPLYHGTSLITYSATDQAGNIGTILRNVDVKDDMEATTIQQQLDDSYHSTISNDGSRQAIIRKTTNDVVVYGIPKSFVQSFGGFGSMKGQMVKLSSDGQILAFTTSDGVRVFAYELGIWEERFASVNRFAEPGSFLYHIELSNDGNTIAVSYPGGNTQYLEEVMIFRWNSTQYVEDHSIANGTAVVSGLGDTMSLSSNGNRIALGSSKFTGGSGSNISSIRRFEPATPSPTLDGVIDFQLGFSHKYYQLTSHHYGGANNTMYWPVTLGSSWSVSWEWYIYGPTWGGGDDMRLIYFATNEITAYQASVHNGYNNFYEFWQGDTHQIRDNNDVYKKSANVYYPLNRWLNIDVSYDNGVMTSTVKNGSTVISKISHNFGTAHQNLYNTQTYFGFSGRTGGVTSSQYITNINLKSTQENIGEIEVYDRSGANNWNQVGSDITGGVENQGLGKRVKLSGDGSTILNKNNTRDANQQNVSVFTLNSGTWTKNSTLIDDLKTRTLLSGETDISDDGSLLIYAKGTGKEKYVSHPTGLSTTYIDGYKLESGVYKHTLTIPESSTTKHVEVTGDGSKILIHNGDEVVLHSVTETVFNPVITLNDRDELDTLTLSQHISYTEQGATSNVTDGSSVLVGGDTVLSQLGVYRVRYSVTDSNTGKSAHRTRTVIII